MPALAFGLGAAKSKAPPSKLGQKRRNLFDDEEENEHGFDMPQNGRKAAKEKITSLGGFDDDEDDSPRPHKSPKLSHSSAAKNEPQAKPQKYTNLASLHSAKLHDAQASTLDASVYDYDGVYETFHAPKAATASGAGEEASGPKYMKSLIASADVRKRDQLRAKEKQLQRERENEGEEFADKEKFVTGAYKAQQEEVKKLEEEEKRKEAAEEERRRKGGGMSGWYKGVLEREEERMRGIEKAAEEARKEGGAKVDLVPDAEDEEETQKKAARELNEKGSHIVVNDEGEVVDKRQLLSAGLNVAKKPLQASTGKDKAATAGARETGWNRSTEAKNARLSQRERQTRMMEQQLEEMTEKARLAELEEQKAQEEKVKSRTTEEEKMGARERFLARKKEREEEARRKKDKSKDGTG